MPFGDEENAKMFSLKYLDISLASFIVVKMFVFLELFVTLHPHFNRIYLWWKAENERLFV